MTNANRATLLALLISVGALAGCGDDEPKEATCDGPCITPQAAFCNGNTAVVPAALGECLNGECFYSPTQTDCSASDQLCVDGACEDPPDPCDGVTCEEPPTARCEGDVLVTFDESGECSDGECAYGRSEQNCADSGRVCDSETLACQFPPDLCIGVTCEEPPETACDGDVVVEYADEGTCDSDTGDCSYAEDRTDCAAAGEFCSDGECVSDDPCDEIVCNTPPAPECTSDTVLLRYSPIGECVAGGECEYATLETNCATTSQICEEGACVDPGPCDGVTCDRPPADFCDGTTAHSFASLGECVGAGACEYDETIEDCATSGLECFAGVCREPGPCDDTECLDPPAGGCDGDTAFAFANPGICVEEGDDAVCTYERLEEDCAADGLGCVDGACDFVDRCLDVVCDTPPLNSCEGDTSISYLSPGTCLPDGTCDYTRLEDDCAELGTTCEAGICLTDDPCRDVECTPPAASCSGNTAIRYTDEDACFEGTCDFARIEVRENCSVSSKVCVDGDCVPPGLAVRAGDLVISEFFTGGSAGNPDFVEIANLTDGFMELEGLQLENGSGEAFSLPAGTTINGRGILVVAAEGVAGVDVVWSDFSLSDGSGTLLISGFEVVHEFDYDGTWPDASATPVNLDPAQAFIAPSDAASWCASPAELGATAGLPPVACPARLDTMDLFISEVMVDGNVLFGDTEQWIELYNPTDERIRLAGLPILTSSGAFVVAANATLDAEAYALVGTQPTIGFVFPDAVVETLEFGTDAGESITIGYGASIVDSLDFATISPFTEGRSEQLDPTAFDADRTEPTNWCEADISIPGPAENFGTPRAMNVCP